MSWREAILNYISIHRSGVDDDELTRELGLSRRQHTNAICNKLEREGMIERNKARGKIHNFPVNKSTTPAEQQNKTPSVNAANSDPSITVIDSRQLVLDFCVVAGRAGVEILEDIITVETLNKPHRQTGLPKGKMAVYVFIWGSRCLKVGKVGPDSNARYTYQHYNPKSSKSNLAKSLIDKKDIMGLSDRKNEDIGEWIKKETCRINFLVPAHIGMPVLSLLEAFLQCRLRPEFEGFDSQRQ